MVRFVYDDQAESISRHTIQSAVVQALYRRDNDITALPLVAFGLDDASARGRPHPAEGVDGLPDQLIAVDQNQCRPRQIATQRAENHSLAGPGWHSNETGLAIQVNRTFHSFKGYFLVWIQCHGQFRP